MKIKRTVYHKEGYKKVAQEVEIQLTVEELKQAHDEYDYLWKGYGGGEQIDAHDKRTQAKGY